MAKKQNAVSSEGSTATVADIVATHPIKTSSQALDTAAKSGVLLPKGNTSQSFDFAFAKYITDANLSSVQRATVDKEVQSIIASRERMVESILSIGDSLRNLRSELSGEQFNKMCTNVFPALGLSRSSAYRYMAQAEYLESTIPNKVARNTLMLLGDGRAIVTEVRDGEGKMTGFTLSPHFKAQLESHPIPDRKAKPSTSEMWAREVVALAGKARSEARNVGKDNAAIRIAAVKSLNRVIAHQAANDAAVVFADCFKYFCKKHGEDRGEALIDRLTKVLESRAWETPEAGTTAKTAKA